MSILKTTGFYKFEPRLVNQNILTQKSFYPAPVYLITEFCRHGDLASYLLRNKHIFVQGDDPTRRR